MGVRADDFSRYVVQKLADRAGTLCSSCRRHTKGPSAEHTAAVANIGRAAHICAASAGGPRFDASMSAEQRSSIQNAIWLCANCHDVIDRDAATYSATRLRDLKQQHETLIAQKLVPVGESSLQCLVRPAEAGLLSSSKGSRLHNVAMYPAQYFVGREGCIAQLEELLLHGSSSYIAACIEGLAGIGKTEIALQLAYRLSNTNAYPAGIFWLDASRRDLFDIWGGAIADELGIEPGPAMQRANKVIEHISNQQSKSLVILDNVADWSSVERPSPLPAGSRVSLLVTSQARALGGQGFVHFHLEALSTEASRQLLVAIAGAEFTSGPGLEELLEYLGGHVLALELAGAFLARYAITPAEYLSRLLKGIPVEKKISQQSRYNATVNAAFEAIFDRLDAASARALGICGCFADADGSIELLRACGVEEDTEAILRGLHLITGGAERWSMHRLVRAFARRTIDKTSRYSIDESLWDGCRKRLRSGPMQASSYKSDRLHFEYLAEVAIDDQDTLLPWSILILKTIGAAASAAGASRTAERYFEACADLRRRAQQTQMLAVSTGGIAPKLSPHQLHALAKPSPVLDTHVANADIETAWNLLQNGKNDEAVSLLSRAAEALKREKVFDRALFLNVKLGIASALAEMGRLHEAERSAFAVLKFAERHFAMNSTEVALVRAGVGVILSKRGQFKKAIRMLEMSLKPLELASHDEYGEILAKIGYVRSKMGQGRMAAVHIEQALSVMIKTYGSDHFATVRMRVNLAVVLLNANDLPNARQHLTAVDGAVQDLGPWHHISLLYRTTLARALCAEGDSTGARTVAAAALEAARTLPPGSPVRVGVELELAGLLMMESPLSDAT
jgi:tetratricopeptide (TPR) repeat protein